MRNRLVLSSAFVLLLGGVWACSSTEPPVASPDGMLGSASAPEPAESAPAEAPAGAAAKDPVLEIGELKLENTRGEAITLGKDGKLMDASTGRVMGTLHPDGRFVDANGTERIRLQPDGRLVSPKGTVMPVTITDKPEVVVGQGQQRVSVDDKGELKGANAGAPDMKITGAKGALKRTALMVLVLVAFPLPNELLGGG